MPSRQRPAGIAQAFLIGDSFIGENGVALILGDNIFHGKLDWVRTALAREEGATIFACPVIDPSRYGIVEFDESGHAISIEEKPTEPKSNHAVPGLYIYDGQIREIARALKPSPRGELEITDVNREYLRRGCLFVEPLGRGVAWLDTGTPESMMEASTYIATLEHRQGVKIACLEEIAYYMDFISFEDLQALARGLPKKNSYRAYLESLAPFDAAIQGPLLPSGLRTAIFQNAFVSGDGLFQIEVSRFFARRAAHLIQQFGRGQQRFEASAQRQEE